ncbi:hypothetical protein N8J89_22555 [Crossiella sp. CA-258035]|uniref:hypothetical protein n=1 Tax=Crossiella sp. CA-258035 TaxID=2981138 RepID=UPI0024BD16C8|nr:hypothetical protein [Crossiella sp. CA-258035]WHT15914.1 hypothetical protein N8J89_22555 [Crossiella sp. CA-258035]
MDVLACRTGGVLALSPPRWLWRLTGLAIVVSMTVGVLMSLAIGPASPFFLAVALLAFLPLAARHTWLLGGLCLLVGAVQVVVGLIPFLILYAVSGGVLILVGLLSFLARGPAAGTPGGSR